MHGLVALLVPIVVMVIVALVIIVVAERFSPDPMIAYIIKCIVFGVVLIALIMKLFPLLGIG